MKIQSKLKNIKIIIGNLGVFIYIEFNKILGDYLRTILSKITKINYISQRSPISEKSELGEYIEFYYLNKESQILV